MSDIVRLLRGLLRRVRRVIDRGDRWLERRRAAPDVPPPEPTPVLAMPLEVALLNVDLVVAALREADIRDWGLVRNQSHNRFRIAVLERDRERFRRVIEASTPTVQVRAVRRDGANRTAPFREIPRDVLEQSHIWRVFREYRVPTSTSLRYGALQGCDVEFWNVSERGDLEAPSRNLVSQVVPAEEARFVGVEAWGRDLQVLQPLWVDDRLEDHTEPVDVVYTWVDSTDPAWRERYREARARVTGLHEEAANAARFEGVDHLRYSLRSLAMYAPWVRNVYIVTDDQAPAWLDRSAAGIRVVDHRELFGVDALLPTFNSHAIESVLHRIEGLSETYLYFNDDVFLGRMTSPDTFTEPNGLLRIFPSVDHIDLGPIRSDERPFMAASKVVRDLIAGETGRRVTQKVKHAPHVQSRTLLTELEQRYADLLAKTRASQFRSSDDLSLAAGLHPWCAFAEGRAVRSELDYTYVNTSEPGLEATLADLAARRDRDVFCLNDTTADADEMARIAATVEPFLRDYFPVASPYEDGTR